VLRPYSRCSLLQTEEEEQKQEQQKDEEVQASPQKAASQKAASPKMLQPKAADEPSPPEPSAPAEPAPAEPDVDAALQASFRPKSSWVHNRAGCIICVVLAAAFITGDMDLTFM